MLRTQIDIKAADFADLRVRFLAEVVNQCVESFDRLGAFCVTSWKVKVSSLLKSSISLIDGSPRRKASIISFFSVTFSHMLASKLSLVT